MSDLDALALAAAELVDEIADQAERDRQSNDHGFTDGYQAGFAAGADVGRYQAETDAARDWVRLAKRARMVAGLPTVAAAERLRWDGPRSDFGRPRPGDYTGGPASMEAWEAWVQAKQAGRGAVA